MPSSHRASPAGARQRRRARRLLALFLVLALATTRGVTAETTDGDAASTGDIPPPVEKVEVAKYFNEFTREGPYPYQICAELPGEIGDPETVLTSRSARCIPVESGELEFCSGVSYDVCSRVVSPSAYDDALKAEHDEQVARHALERPRLATTACHEAFETYVCLLGFPRCEEDSQNPGTYLELPLCYDYCVKAHGACAQPLEKSQAACDVAVARGRVAPPRRDVTCVSSGFRNGLTDMGLAFVLAVVTARIVSFGGEHEGPSEAFRRR